MFRTFQLATTLASVSLVLSGCSTDKPREPTHHDDKQVVCNNSSVTVSGTECGTRVVVCRKSDNVKVYKVLPIDTRKFTRDLSGCKKGKEERRAERIWQRQLDARQKAVDAKEKRFERALNQVPASQRSLTVISEFCKNPEKSSGNYTPDESRTGVVLSSYFLEPLYDKYREDSSIELPSDLEDSFIEGVTFYGAEHKFCPPLPFTG